MIQRKQSLFLFIAALLNALLFIVPFYRWHEAGDTVWHELRLNTFFPAFLVAIVITLLPLVAIFMFRKRKQQMAMCGVSLLSITTFLSMMLAKVGNLVPANAIDGTYWIGAALPVVAFIFIILAMAGIRKDDKLVKSMDRLR
ncbi:hypothetical protein CJD36_011315 [Flavipsychrobacter stenotrophus]|uniref:DUF4293 domain-containing protein n=1 Tax=Flavipsychrobacter stenotrophus TaxID=2077091 RepID=A0A2S7SVA7_9BACT|nr:DUF4293 domain-containing protein [Flavipsychrobacter stenotrophus]PQJ10557.1 hypothetical protein CJD36_011315 [Flavipsychrobacter stenotrophus]